MLSLTSNDNERQRGVKKIETATTTTKGKRWQPTTTKNTTVTRDNNVE
jgi:hypothetical protein